MVARAWVLSYFTAPFVMSVLKKSDLQVEYEIIKMTEMPEKRNHETSTPIDNSIDLCYYE